MDKYYKSLLLSDGMEQTLKAGYLCEKFSPDFQGEVNKNKVKEGGIILLTTGSFALMHEGHVSMMEQAKESLESQGLKVAGGFFSFSHDDYVLKKADNMPSLSARINHAKYILNSSDWLSVDCWEALLPGVVNFTTVIKYFELKFPQHEIIYVFGKTEFSFAWAFKHHGKAVYVPASGVSEEVLNQIRTTIPRTLITNPSRYSNLHSRDLRKPVYVLRDDSAFLPFNDLSYFKSSLISLLEKASGYPVKVLDVKSQLQWAENKTKELKTLSLDMYFKGNYQLEISRLFGLNAQTSGKKLMERCGCISIEEQMKKIPAGNYLLVEDDVASGETLKRIKELLPKDVFISDLLVLSEAEGKLNIFDIVDLRDFLIGAPGGGLQIETLSGKIGRAPYFSPFINLETRAKIFKMDPREFTKTVLDLNLSLFKNLELKIKDIDKAQQTFFTSLGFDLDMPIVELCTRLKEYL